MKQRNFVRMMMVLMALAASLNPAPVAANPALDPPPPYFSYLPAVVVPENLFAVSGQITDETTAPLSGVLVADDSGRQTISDANGYYVLMTPAGERSLAAQKDGYMFSPSINEVIVTGNVDGQDFTAQTACSQAFSNTGFENNTYWGFPSSAWPAVYSTDVVHGGSRSARTGILNLVDNRYSYSSVRSPAVSLPAGASSITLGVWLYFKSGEPVQSAQTQTPLVLQEPGSAAAYDAQYVQVLDGADNALETLMWTRSNSQMWTYHTFNLTRWAGSTIKIQLGTYNDGSDSITAMYVDDMTLQVCGGTPPPPPPPPQACSNQMTNSGFEANSAWTMPYTAFPADYSYDYAYSGWRSMRTGVPFTVADTYSYSDAWQTVTIPSTATSAKLRMKLLPKSEQFVAARELAAAPPEEGTVWGDAQLASDAQYVLILNPSTQQTIATLIWWTGSNASAWQSMEFDLLAYKGQSIRIQFGSYNNGYGGRTVMYADDVYVDTCTSTPPAVCTEKVTNGGFESGAGWYIPTTEFSAGYSTFLKHGGARSMRTGIYYWYHNRYSYSDASQAVSIPAWIGSATLRFYGRPITSEFTSAMLAEHPTAAQFGPSAMSGDAQYLLVLDYWGNWIDTLIWQRVNSSGWVYYQFDLKRFAGSTITLQFGTYNNGYDGVTAFYIDDVSLQVCP